MTDFVLETVGLNKRYGDFYANTDVSINFREGGIHGIIGPNGAGKTTLFNCLVGAIPVTSGQIIFNGQGIHGLPQHKRPSLGIGRSFQVTNLFGDLSVFENLRLASQALKSAEGYVFWKSVVTNSNQRDKINQILHTLGLEANKDNYVRELSHGQQRLLEVGMALTTNPRVVLLDEPTSGMGIDDIPQIIQLLHTLKTECTVVLIEHNVKLVTEVCDYVSVLQSGLVIAEGTPKEISANEKVKVAYLGEAL